MERGWDPQVKDFFVRILNSVAWGLLWMLACATAGIYNKLGFIGAVPLWASLLFYCIMAVSFFFLLRYIIRMWRSKPQ